MQKIEVYFPVSPWKNNYLMVKACNKKKPHRYYPQTPIQNMIAYSYLEKMAHQIPDDVKHANDAYSFIIKNDEVFEKLNNIINGPLAITLNSAIKDDEIVYIDYLSEASIFSTPLCLVMKKVYMEPICYARTSAKKYFVIKCKKFSGNNPYVDKDLMLSNICIINDSNESNESAATTIMKVFESLLFGGEMNSGVEMNNVNLNVNLWNKISEIIEAYFAEKIFPIILLLFADAIYRYNKVMFLYLHLKSFAFRQIFSLAHIYNGANKEECKKKLNLDSFSVTGLRGTM